jgi:hypothetical protein
VAVLGAALFEKDVIALGKPLSWDALQTHRAQTFCIA